MALIDFNKQKDILFDEHLVNCANAIAHDEIESFLTNMEVFKEIFANSVIFKNIDIDEISQYILKEVTKEHFVNNKLKNSAVKEYIERFYIDDQSNID